MVMYIYINVATHSILSTYKHLYPTSTVYRCEVDYRDIPPILLRCKLCHASLLLWAVTWTRRRSPFPPLRTSNTARSCRMLWWWSTPLPTPPAAVPCACCTSQPPPQSLMKGCNGSRCDRCAAGRTTEGMQRYYFMYKIRQTFLRCQRHNCSYSLGMLQLCWLLKQLTQVP